MKQSLDIRNIVVLVSVILFWIIALSAGAQETAPSDSLSIHQPDLQIEAESSDTLQARGVDNRKYEHGVPLSKNPGWAAMRSVVLPGWGQAYVGNWISATLFAGAEAGLIYGAYVQHDRYVTALDKADNVKKDEDRIILERSANFYRDDRNKIFWYIGGLTILASLDAFVEAHLYDFHIDPILKTPPSNDGIQVGFRFTFSL
jgi:Family of unknown function (DUF5683)